MAGRVRRWSKRVGLGLLAIVVFVLGIVLAVALTDVGTRVATEEAVRRYSDSVPGEVAFDGIEGSLGDRVCIRGLRLSDAAEHELVTVELVCLELHWSRLLHRAVEVDSLHAEGATVHLWADAQWSDLARPSTEPADALPGPDLGIALGGPIRVERFALVQHGDAGEQRIIDHAGLDAELRAAGTEAHASIADVWGWVEPAQLWVADGTAEIAWDSPRVAISEVAMVSSAGVIEALDAELHVVEGTFDADVRAVAIPPADVPLSLARVVIDASGNGSEAGAAIEVVAPEYGRLDAHAIVGLGTVRHAGVVGVLRPTGKPAKVDFVAGASLDGERRSAHAIVSAHRTAIGGALVDDKAIVVASMPGASADAALRLQENALASARGRIRVSSAAQVLDELRRLSPRPVPVLDGSASGEVEAACTRGEAWRCTVDGTARHEEDWLGIGGDVIADARAVVVDLARLDGRVRREPIHLAGPARVHVEDGSATLTDVRLRAAGGRIDANGTLAWKRTPLRSDLELALHRIDLATIEHFVPDAPVRGRVDGRVRLAGTADRPALDASLTGTRLAWDGRALGDVQLVAGYDAGIARADLAWKHRRARASLRAEVPVVASLSGRLELQPRPDQPHAVSLAVERFDLALLEPWVKQPIAGVAFGNVELVSVDGDAKADAIVVAHDVAWNGQRVGAAELQLHADGEGTELDVQGSGPAARLVEIVAELPVELRGPAKPPAWRTDAPLSVTADLRAVDLAAVGRLARFHAVGGDLEGSLTIEGTASTPRMHAAIDVQALRSRGNDLGRVRLVADYEDEALVAELEQRNGVQQVDASGRVPLRVDPSRGAVVWHRDRPHRISVHAKGVDEQLLGTLVDLPSDLRFRLAAEANVAGTVDDPRARVRLRGSASSGETLPSPIALLAYVSPTAQEARLMIGGRGPTGLTVDAQANAPLPALLAGYADIGAIEVDIHAHATDFHLQELAPVLPNVIHDPRGELQLHASIEGPLRGPLMRGSIFMKGGAFTLVPLNQRFREVDIDAAFEGPDVVVRRFTARSGSGSASVITKLHVAPGETKGEARIVARKLPVVRPGLPMMTVSTRIDAALDATGDVTRVALDVHDGFIDVLETKAGNAAQRIPSDDGVTYVDPKGRRAAAKSETAARTPWLPRDFALAVRLADPVRVRGPSADMDWGGALTVERVGDGKASAEGELSTSSGYVALLGNDFDIGHGRITLPAEGELDPYIDLVATADTEEALVTMSVRGRVSRPTLALESNPPMEESDIFALLVTGHSDAEGAEEGDFTAKAASLLAAFENPALQQQLRDTIGIDRVGVGFGETIEQPIVTVGKRLGRKVYVEAAYHHNAPIDENQAEVRLEYRFRPPRWSVETYFGDRAEGGVGLWWRRRFGGPGKPEQPKRRKEQARRDRE